MSLPRFHRLLRRREGALPIVLVTLGILALIVLAVNAGAIDERPAPAPAAVAPTTPAPTESPIPSPTSDPSPTADPSPRLVMHESPILGYRITLPDTYRRLAPAFFIDEPELLGRDTYTSLSEREEREECLLDLGDLPSPTGAALLHVEAYRNTTGVGVAQWARTPRIGSGYVLSTHRKVEPLTLSGGEAVRLVADNATAETEAFAIGASDRIYVISPSMWPSAHDLEAIVATFTTTVPQAFPTPTPTAPAAVRREAAMELAQALARAFTARDADAVARLMPDCHLGISPLIDGQGLANSGGGGLHRSVEAFTQSLRARFAAGDLTVTVDPLLQEGSGAGPFFVRSEWKEPDRTTRVDLVLDLGDGRWQWFGAVHHYESAEVGSRLCIPYRPPWVSRGQC